MLYVAQNSQHSQILAHQADIPYGVNIEEVELQVSSQALSPNLLAAIYESRLLRNPRADTACHLLKTYRHPRFIHSFLSPQWVYWAGTLVCDGQGQSKFTASDILEGYGSALLILDRISSRWHGAAALSQALFAYMQDTQGSL
jgi:hypothetical protein